MKGRTLSVLGIFALAAGAVLIICNKAISLSGVTITCGILFVAVGLINLLLLSSATKTDGALARVLTLASNASAIVLGVCMLVFHATFVPLIAFMFGLLIGVCALWQFFILAVGTRPYQLPAWLYVVPLALAGAAAYSFTIKGHDTDALVMLVTGISLCVTGVGCLIEGSALGVARRRHQHQAAAQQPEEAASPSHATVNTEAQEVDVPADSTAVATQADAPVAVTRSSRPETTEDLDDEIR